jgi:hypothetical protein
VTMKSTNVQNGSRPDMDQKPIQSNYMESITSTTIPDVNTMLEMVAGSMWLVRKPFERTVGLPCEWSAVRIGTISNRFDFHPPAPPALPAPGAFGGGFQSKAPAAPPPTVPSFFHPATDRAFMHMSVHMATSLFGPGYMSPPLPGGGSLLRHEVDRNGKKLNEESEATQKLQKRQMVVMGCGARTLDMMDAVRNVRRRMLAFEERVEILEKKVG